MKKQILVLVVVLCSYLAHSQTNSGIDSLYRNSYKVFELQRLSNGMYRDSKLFMGSDYHPISVSNTGMGLISLCIADAMNWSDNAKDLALNTLKSATGHTRNFTPDRTYNGYFRHFLDTNTGQQAWNSEYSTIDTDILMCGALFCMNYFQDDSISHYVTELWNSIDFEAAIMSSSTGQIFLTMNANGTGVENSLTSPYNEYMIVAWLAKNSSNYPNSPANVLWNNFYSTPDSLPTVSYGGINVLSDNASSFLSSFTHQFNYYLCNHFTTSPDYLDFFNNSQMADSAWWSNNSIYQFEWGLGAGSAITNSYHADAINNNPDKIFSPHIIAGYIPINPNSKNDLINLWNSDIGKYPLPTGNNHHPILWRYSLSDTTWIPNEIIGIDHSTMLFGLSTLPEYLGNSFFSTYNDFFPVTSQIISNSNSEIGVNIYPNPFIDYVIVEFDNEYSDVYIRVDDITGRLIYSKQFRNVESLKLALEEGIGIFIVNVFCDGKTKTFRLCKQ